MVEYTFYYFNIRGRGELIRLMFQLTGKKFQDKRIEFKDWPKYKFQMPFGTVPVLRLKDGEKSIILSQSLTIARYLGRKFGIAGENALEKVLVEMYGDQINDILGEYVKIVFENEPKRKEELEKKFYEEFLPKNLKYFEEKLKKSKSGYLVNSGITWADLLLFNVLDIISDNDSSFLKGYRHLIIHGMTVSKHPKLREYIQNRPKTDM